jgi:hypothetical protein
LEFSAKWVSERRTRRMHEWSLRGSSRDWRLQQLPPRRRAFETVKKTACFSSGRDLCPRAIE